MDRLERAAIVVRLIQQLKARGSWAGETHVQKAVYFLEVLTSVPIGYDFILYRYGPFSFELRDDLAAMRADELLEFKYQGPIYGPSLEVCSSAEALEARYEGLLNRHQSDMEFVCDKLSSMHVDELERVGTALLVLRSNPGLDEASVAERLRALKPHVSEAAAVSAARFVLAAEQDANRRAI